MSLVTAQDIEIVNLLIHLGAARVESTFYNLIYYYDLQPNSVEWKYLKFHYKTISSTLLNTPSFMFRTELENYKKFYEYQLNSAEQKLKSFIPTRGSERVIIDRLA